MPQTFLTGGCYDPQAGKHDSDRPLCSCRRESGRRSRRPPESSVRSSIRPRARCPARPSPSSTPAPTRSASPITDGEGRFSVPEPAAGDLPDPRGALRVPDDRDQGVHAPQRRASPARRSRSGWPTSRRTVTVVGESPLLQTHKRVGRPDASRRSRSNDLPVNGRTLLSFAALSAGVTPQAFNRGTQFGAAGSSRNQYVTRRGRPRQLDQLHRRRRLRAVAALQQPVAGAAGSTPCRKSTCCATRSRPSTARARRSSRSSPSRAPTELPGSAYEFVRSDNFDAKNFFAAAKPELKRNQYGVTTGGGPIKQNKIFVFGSYEGLSDDEGAAVPGGGAEPDAAARQLLGAGHADRRSADRRCQFPGNIIPTSRFSNFAKTLAPTVPAPNAAGANNYNINQELHRRCRHRDDARRSGADRQPQPVRAFHVYDGSQLNPSVFSLHRPAAEGAQSRPRRNVGDLVAVRQRDSLRLQLCLPPELAGQPRWPQLGRRHRPEEPGRAATDPLDYGRPALQRSPASRTTAKAASRRARPRTSSASPMPPAG